MPLVQEAICHNTTALYYAFVLSKPIAASAVFSMSLYKLQLCFPAELFTILTTAVSLSLKRLGSSHILLINHSYATKVSSLEMVISEVKKRDDLLVLLHQQENYNTK
jgi:hypothetical protein